MQHQNRLQRMHNRRLFSFNGDSAFPNLQQIGEVTPVYHLDTTREVHK